MSYVPRDPITHPLKVNELRNAVARWEYEGGADVTGPREGYGIGDHSSTIPLPPVRQGAVEALVDVMHLDQLVRLLFAVSEIHNEGLALETQGTKETLSLLSVRRKKVVPDRIIQVVTHMIHVAPAHAMCMDLQ
jgi:hypothetical protein